MESIYPILVKASLNLPEPGTVQPQYGGRYGEHTVYLQPLLQEMGEVFRLDPTASW